MVKNFLLYFPIVISIFLFGCKNVSELDQQLLETDEDRVAANDNRTTEGGLMGSADVVDKSTLPGVFQINGNFPATKDFKHAPPPEPKMNILRGADQHAAKIEAKRWMDAAQSYFYQDMNNQDPSNINNNFKTIPGEVSGERWYHMPWLHSARYSPEIPGRGREPIWGLTREVDIRTDVDECVGQAWGIAFFNEPGGYTIGRIFPEGQEVRPDLAVFPKGTLSFKMLFAKVDSLSEYDGALEINAYVNAGGRCFGRRDPQEREIARMRHIQMDIMYRYGDGPEDWLFGVWVYKKTSKSPYWQGMHPLGVQFGVAHHETIIIDNEMVPNGYHGRLNGPADNPMSSCYSCHARAQWPEVARQRLPFAPRDATDTEMICLLHDWGGEGSPGCPPCAADGECIPGGMAPIVPSGLTADYALQTPLGLRNRTIATGLR